MKQYYYWIAESSTIQKEQTRQQLQRVNIYYYLTEAFINSFLSLHSSVLAYFNLPLPVPINNLYVLMSVRQYKRTQLQSPSYNITPWQQQNKIPDHYLNSVITPPSKYKAIFGPHIRKKENSLNRTFDKQMYTLKSHPIFSKSKNIGCIELIQYSWTDPKAPECIVPERSRDKKTIIARKRTRKGLQIKSIKKKIIDSSQLQVKHYPFFQEPEPLKQRFRFITESQLNSSDHSTLAEGSFFPKSKQRRTYKTKNLSITREFLTEISSIASISKEKRTNKKCITEQICSPDSKDWKLQRSLFLQTNPKFKTWQARTNKTITSTMTLPVDLA